MTTTPSIWLLGGGGHAKVVIDAAQLSGRPASGLFDDNPNPTATILGITHLGTIEDAAARIREDEFATAHLAIGQIHARRTILDRFAAQGLHAERFASIIHPAAIVSAGTTIARGVFIAPGAIINPSATLANHTIINTAAIIEHDVTIAENTHIAPHATICGGVTVGPNTLIGAAATILPGIRIGEGVTIGAGTIVLHDVPNQTTLAGNPARPIRSSK